MKSKYEIELESQLKVLPKNIQWEKEYRFYPTRKWRSDFAFPKEKILVEVEGGIWNNGRHNRGSGYQKDCEKYNRAAIEGWLVLRFTPKMITSMSALADIFEILKTRGIK